MRATSACCLVSPNHLLVLSIVRCSMDPPSQNVNISVLPPKKKGKRNYASKEAAKKSTKELHEGIDKIRDLVQLETAALAERLGM